MSRTIPFPELGVSDLIINAIHKCGRNDNASDDSLSKLMYCGNQGGFPIVGSSDSHCYLGFVTHAHPKEFASKHVRNGLPVAPICREGSLLAIRNQDQVGRITFAPGGLQ